MTVTPLPLEPRRSRALFAPAAAGAGRPRHLLPRRLAEGVALGLVVGLAAALLGPLAVGGRTFAVLSGSMEPTLGVGDLVLERKLAASEIRAGQIVTFRSPQDPSLLVTHRVRAVSIADGVVHVITKGDANLTVERWTVPAKGHVSRVLTRVPAAGYLLVWTRSTTGRLLLVVLPACLLGLVELRRIWRTPAGGARAARS